jgi:hypothetical protein
VDHPRTNGAISLRARATDTKGNTVTLIIISAYYFTVR